MSKDDKRRCRECGGTIRVIAKAGREWSYKGLTFLVPADFAIPTCNRCGEQWLDPVRARALDRELESQFSDRLFERFATAVQALLSQGFTQKHLERVLGVSQGYVSHVVARRKTPSPMLVREVVLLAKEPKKRMKEAEAALDAALPPWLASPPKNAPGS